MTVINQPTCRLFTEVGQTTQLAAYYDTEISGYIDKKRIKKLKGLKVNGPIVSPPVNEIIVDDPPTGNIQFKGFGGISKTLPLEYFVAGQ